MRKTNDTMTRELTEAELAVVSGGTEPIVKSTSSVDHQEFVIVKLFDKATP